MIPMRDLFLADLGARRAAAKKARGRSRRSIGPPGTEKVIPDKRKKPPKYKLDKITVIIWQEDK
jgi:hypothetical protein